MHPKTAARQLALRALVRSESNDMVAPDFGALSPDVRPFAREIYSGTQRHRAKLDWTLAPLLSKPIGKLDPPIRAALRLAAYEKLVLNTPPHGFVGEYAGLMREERKESAVGFVNAVARRIPAQWRALPADLPQQLAIEFSHPQWLVQRYIKQLGAQQTRELLRANNERAPLCLRANTLKTSRDALLQRLPEARAGAISPDALILDGGDPTRLPGWNDGDFFVQDEAAQLVACYAAPTAEMRVLDLAGAPGGKATHCAQLMENRGRIECVDIAPGRLKLVRENAARLGISILRVQTADVRELSGIELADLVLLDAPCLGTGTLRRRPDAKWRKTPNALAELVALQRELLGAAAKLVKPSGALVYSTCSLEPEENAEQARAFTQRSGWPIERAPDWMKRVQTPEGWLQSWPHRDGTDGMFAAKWRRPAE